MQNILRVPEDTFATPEVSSQSQSKSESSESKENEVIANQEFVQLLKRLGLESHYPRKMGMGDFRTICKISLQDSQPSQDTELPFYFLQKLLTVDYRVRYLTCWEDSNPKLAALPKTTTKKHQYSDTFEQFFDDLEEATPERASRDGRVHYMDLQMAIFHCADDFLRQTLATKLAFCQLAVPLLLPNPSTSRIEFLLYALSQIQRSWKEVEKSGKQAPTKSYSNKLIFQAQTPIVSFIRIGSSASSSKSRLLNPLLSKRKHDTFFHRNCRGSTRERLLMEGMVEIAWYCPGGSPDDTFERCVAFCNLHEIAAELMVSGYPMELLDGDASYLPLCWVGAIFDSLIERLGDKRVFVLSVLGIQSTGKSTLLNAMFGLQFNVSAGRCTRGAFMQLIPVNKIQNGDLQKVTTAHLEGLVRETSDAIEKEVEKYFTEENDRGILVQWKSSSALKLKELKEALLDETQKKCENFIELQKEQRKLDTRKLQYEDELLRRSRELAVSLKGKSLSERELEDNFTLVWNQWIAEVSRDARPQERVDIDAEIEDILVEHFKEPGIHARIRSYPKGRGFSIDPEKHIMKKKHYVLFQGFRSISNTDAINFQHITDNIIACVKTNIAKKEEEKRDYSRNFIHEVLNEVQKGVDSVPSNAECTFNREYSIDLSLYLCRMAAGRFKAMHEAFQKANDPVVYLSSKREDFFQCFQISCQGATSVTTFVVFLCHKIEPALCSAVYERTAKDIAEDMQGKFPDFRGSRANLELCILKYLAEEENFEYFKQYLTSPKQFCETYIETCVRNYCLDGNRRLGMFLDSSLDILCQKILSAVSKSTQIVKDRKYREDKVSLWLDEFCRELSEVINLPRSDLKGIEHQEVTDIEFLSRAMTEALAALKDTLVNELADADLSWFPRQPHTILAEHFSRCWAQCPFCGAVCTNTMWNHDGDHQLVFHRPQALLGCTWWECSSGMENDTHEMNIDICSSLVASDYTFRVGGGRWIPYKRYRDAGPPYSTWNILPDTSMQAYWKWFVSHFRTQLEDLYNGKFQGKGEIPEAWQRISKQEALTELDKCSPCPQKGRTTRFSQIKTALAEALPKINLQYDALMPRGNYSFQFFTNFRK
ncbi:interferon-induced very large GTPase 1-like [Passer montanus]|uniref:interferon-induced very large GTPase 1-like n=1 Tax=Passer montanus TaxID=9160 RepID=UPI00195F3A42|nr:interferon-induced very large GTPase 1-like [Passer montanus]